MASAPPRDAARVADMLAQGVQDITQHMVADEFKLNEVLRMILETMYRALGFRRVVFCLRDPKSNLLTGRFGLGEGAAETAAAIKVPLKLMPGVAPDLRWSAEKMQYWVRGLKPVCASAEMAAAYPDLLTDPRPLMRQAWGHEPTAEEADALIDFKNGTGLPEQQFMMTCVAVLTALDFVSL